MTAFQSPRSSQVLASLFPAGVLTAELTGVADRACLLPEELLLIANVAPKRAADFIAGRCCARFLLATWGLQDIALLSGPNREPLWPERVTGSITHTRGFCGVVIAERVLFKSVGLDTESASAVSADILHQICTPQEARWLDTTLDSPHRDRAQSLIFSAKEAFFKCQFPLTDEWVGFEDVVVHVNGDMQSDSGTLRLQPLKPLRFHDRDWERLECRYRFHDEWISVGVALPNDQ
jgi:4'-phosphopantetheinyl transferase EntD